MEFYKKLSKVYDKLFIKNKSMVDFLSENLPSNSTILDAGCSTGAYSLALSEEGFNVIGIDIDNFMIDKARDNRGFLPVKFYKYDIREISSKFKENQFDEIFCINNVFSTLMDKEEILETLKSMNKCLKENGVLIIEIDNYNNISNKSIENGDVKLIKEYVKNREDVKLKQTLTTKNKYLETECSTLEIPLINIKKDELISLLESTGFINMEIFGSANKENFYDQSHSLIVRAIKEPCLLSDSEDYEDYDINVVKEEKQSCCKNNGGCCKK